jgi:glycosyltransferase involved in cell wall biosynthesis
MRQAHAPAERLHVGLLPTLPFHAGISMQVYASTLVESLAAVPGVYAELLNPPFRSREHVGWTRSHWIRYVAYPAWAASQRAQVFHVVDHGNAQLLWRLPRRSTVVTCHDLYPLAIAAGRLRFAGAPTRAQMLPTAVRLQALRRARMVVTVSRHTASECQEYLGIRAARLRVVYESVSDAFWEPGAPGELERTRARLEIDPDDLVVLHVGSNDPRKNLPAVCRVVAGLRTRTRRPVKLVKVGPQLGRDDLEFLRSDGIDGRELRQVGRVSLAELVGIYHAATVLLYPSFHEGFCRPVAEAMAAGLPVVASAAGAIPEVAGRVAALYEPTDTAGMVAGIADIGEDPRRRRQMSEAGREESRRFTGDGHGRALAAVYQEVAVG